MKSTIAHLISSVFGLGFSPLAPGTVGALAGLLVSVIVRQQLALSNNPVLWWTVCVVCMTLIGVLASNQSTKEWGKDPQKVVVDEFVGMWISVVAVPITALNMLIALALFRFFDIVKPLGIRQAEKLPGGLGIMADDVLAGFYSLILIHVYLLIATVL